MAHQGFVPLNQQPYDQQPIGQVHVNGNPNLNPRAVPVMDEVMVANGFDLWEIGLLEAPFKQPSLFCQNLFCCYCKAYDQREQTAEPGNYFRCLDQGGKGTFFPCDSAVNCCVCQKSPFLCLETFCCPVNSIILSRRRIIHRLKLRNSDCDDLAFRCLFSAGGGDGRSDFGLFGLLLGCCCMACMLTQQRVELDRRGFPAMRAGPAREEMGNEGPGGMIPMVPVAAQAQAHPSQVQVQAHVVPQPQGQVYVYPAQVAQAQGPRPTYYNEGTFQPAPVVPSHHYAMNPQAQNNYPQMNQYQNNQNNQYPRIQ